jgi:hypothetical protein
MDGLQDVSGHEFASSANSSMPHQGEFMNRETEQPELQPSQPDEQQGEIESGPLDTGAPQPGLENDQWWRGAEGNSEVH